jgi:hypothetical protein
MIPGAERLVSYLWQQWIRQGRKCQALPIGAGWELRQTARYRWSLIGVLVAVSVLFAWLVQLVLRLPDELALLVLCSAAGLVWTLCAGGAANAHWERIRIDHRGLGRRSLRGTGAMAWDQLAGFRLPAGDDVVLVDLAGKELRINAFLDGRGTLLAQLQRHADIPSSVESRLACETRARTPTIAR